MQIYEIYTLCRQHTSDINIMYNANKHTGITIYVKLVLNIQIS